MRYHGGKNGSGVFQKLICMMPKHRLYVEAFLGSGAILRRKRPAEKSLAFELDRDTIFEFVKHVPADVFKPESGNGAWISPKLSLPYNGGTSLIWESPTPDTKASLEVLNVDAVDYLQTKMLPSSYFWGFHDPAEALIYADPPYRNADRSSPGRIYKYELLSDQEHAELLDLFLAMPCKVIISGYDNDLYNRKLRGWRREQYATVNRAGTRIIETAWLNFPEPAELHDYTHVGENRRDRWRMEKRLRNWTGQLKAMTWPERGAMLARLNDEVSELYASELERERKAAESLVRRAKVAERKLFRQVTPEKASSTAAEVELFT
jgi:DNA adenine methylase